MTIGNALTAQLAADRFDRLQSEIGEIQTRISDGTNDPRPSSDPSRAAALAAGREQQMRIAGYAANASAADNRLSLTDAALASMASTLREVKDLALQTANTATSGYATGVFRTQLVELRKALIALGNTADASGQPLFGGLSTRMPFELGTAGVSYRGDTGQVQVQLSESHRLATGISGDEALMSIATENGTHSAFAMIDDLEAGLSSLAGTSATGSFQGGALLQLQTSTRPVPLTFTITGPAGAAQLTVLPQAGAPEPVADAINALRGRTGISAEVDPASGGILLSGAGEITLSDFASADDKVPLARLSPLEGPSSPVKFRAASMSDDAVLGRIAAAIDHMAEVRGRVGAIASEVDRQTKRLSERKLTVDQAVAGLDDLDLAAASSRLAALMTQQQAAMQTYTMINAKTLFDFLG